MLTKRGVGGSGEGLGISIPLDNNCVTPQAVIIRIAAVSKMFWRAMRLIGMEWAADGREMSEGEKWNSVDPLCLGFVLTSKISRDSFRIRAEIDELIVYQESIYLKESEIGKAIFALCSKVSCVMQLAMTTKLMDVCSRSQWARCRPTTWIKSYTWCSATPLECEMHSHFITQGPRLTFVCYVAYITGWLSQALITYAAWSKLNMIDLVRGRGVSRIVSSSYTGIIMTQLQNWSIFF